MPTCASILCFATLLLVTAVSSTEDGFDENPADEESWKQQDAFVLFGSITVLDSSSSVTPKKEGCHFKVVVEIGEQKWEEPCPSPDYTFTLLPSADTNSAESCIDQGTVGVYLIGEGNEADMAPVWLRHFRIAGQTVVQLDATIVLRSIRSTKIASPGAVKKDTLSVGSESQERGEPEPATCWLEGERECVPVDSGGNSSAFSAGVETGPRFTCRGEAEFSSEEAVCNLEYRPRYLDIVRAWTTFYLPAAAIASYLLTRYLQLLLISLTELLSMYRRTESGRGADRSHSERHLQQDFDDCIGSAPWLVRLACPSPGGTLRKHGPRMRRHGSFVATGECHVEDAQAQADRSFSEVLDPGNERAACFYYQCTSQTRKPPLPPGSWNRTGTGRLERHYRARDGAFLVEE